MMNEHEKAWPMIVGTIKTRRINLVFQLPSIKCARFVWIAWRSHICTFNFLFVPLHSLYVKRQQQQRRRRQQMSIRCAVSLACENGMRLSCLHAKYEAKRVYDKWPIKCIKAISHSFSHRYSGAHTLFFFSLFAFHSDHVWISRKTNGRTKKGHQQNERVYFAKTSQKNTLTHTQTTHKYINAHQKCYAKSKMSRLFQLVMHCLTNIIVISIMIRRRSHYKHTSRESATCMRLTIAAFFSRWSWSLRYSSHWHSSTVQCLIWKEHECRFVSQTSMEF